MYEQESRALLRASLYEIALQTPNVTALARFYRNALGYSFECEQSGVLGLASERRLHLSGGASRTLAYAAYVVPDLDDLRGLEKRLTQAGVAFQTVASAGMSEALKFDDPDGNSFIFGLPAVQAGKQLDEVSKRPARLQHVVFASTDVSRLLTFFIDVVGFTLSDRVFDNDGTLTTAFLRCSHEHHSLAIFAASENRLDHHCYEASEWSLIRDWADSFAKHRIPLKWGPGRHGPGNNLFLFIHDPDGNWVEISAELETVEHDRPIGNWPHEEYTLNSWGQGLLRS